MKLYDQDSNGFWPGEGCGMVVLERLSEARRQVKSGGLKVNDRTVSDERGLVWRYRAADGLEGEEGTFLLCTFWLAQAQALAGELDQARATFERAAAYANDVGLLAEEVDPGGAEMIGNYPQAFSHIGLVNAAWAITEAERRQATAGG